MFHVEHFLLVAMTEVSVMTYEKIKRPRRTKCKKCAGTGKRHDTMWRLVPCRDCAGRGYTLETDK